MSILDQIALQKKVLILGFAREGKSTKVFLHHKFPELQIDTADKTNGNDYLSTLKNYSIVIKTPGISPHLPEIIDAKKSGVIFTSHMQLFFEVCPSKNIIAVTGTKGKSTTTSLIYHTLKYCNIPSILVGNIGIPALDQLPEITPDTWVICELSSYQLLDLEFSPHIAVLQNIYPDHLDYHQSMDEYIKAKSNIARFQTPKDYFIFNDDNQICKDITHLTPATKMPFRISSNTNFGTKLLGTHNQYNVMPSLLIGQKIMQLPTEKINAALKSFTPLETRLELVATKNAIQFYADTLATIPEATMAALDALPHTTTLIAGGHDRNQNYLELAQKITTLNIQTVILFPETGIRLEQELNKLKHSLKLFHAKSMSEAITLAITHTPPNTICLFSPAAPNFTLFKDYQDARDQYKKTINL